MRHAIHPDADAEFAGAVGYYAAIDPQLGARFYREIERLIHVAEMRARPNARRLIDCSGLNTNSMAADAR